MPLRSVWASDDRTEVFDEVHRSASINLFYRDRDDLLLGGRNILADVVWAYWEFPVATVNEDAEGDSSWSSFVKKGFNGSPGCTTGIEDVVTEDDFFTSDVDGIGAAVDFRKLCLLG